MSDRCIFLGTESKAIQGRKVLFGSGFEGIARHNEEGMGSGDWGHFASTARKQRVINADTQLKFFFFFNSVS